MAYKLIEEPIREKPGLNWSFAPIGGFRYHYLKEEIKLKATVAGLGYKIFDMDYERGSGKDMIGFDGKLHGPIIGLTILL